MFDFVLYWSAGSLSALSEYCERSKAPEVHVLDFALIDFFVLAFVAIFAVLLEALAVDYSSTTEVSPRAASIKSFIVAFCVCFFFFIRRWIHLRLYFRTTVQCAGEYWCFNETACWIYAHTICNFHCSAFEKKISFDFCGELSKSSSSEVEMPLEPRFFLLFSISGQ